MKIFVGIIEKYNYKKTTNDNYLVKQRYNFNVYNLDNKKTEYYQVKLGGLFKEVNFDINCVYVFEVNNNKIVQFYKIANSIYDYNLGKLIENPKAIIKPRLIRTIIALIIVAAIFSSFFAFFKEFFHFFQI